MLKVEKQKIKKIKKIKGLKQKVLQKGLDTEKEENEVKEEDISSCSEHEKGSNYYQTCFNIIHPLQQREFKIQYEPAQYISKLKSAMLLKS